MIFHELLTGLSPPKTVHKDGDVVIHFRFQRTGSGPPCIYQHSLPPLVMLMRFYFSATFVPRLQKLRISSRPKNAGRHRPMQSCIVSFFKDPKWLIRTADKVANIRFYIKPNLSFPSDCGTPHFWRHSFDGPVFFLLHALFSSNTAARAFFLFQLDLMMTGEDAQVPFNQRLQLESLALKYNSSEGGLRLLPQRHLLSREMWQTQPQTYLELEEL